MSETKNAPPRVGRWYRVGGTVMQCGGTDVSDVPARHVFLADDGADVKIAVSEWPSADAVSLGTTGQRFAALEERVAALEARDRSMSTTPTILNIPGGFITRRDVYGDAKPSLAPPAVAGPTWEETVRDAARVIADEIQGRPIACNIDHDACSAEQRSGTGRAAQGPCVRGVVDLVAASADDQHAAERGKRERVRADYTAHVSAERRKWATAIASALDGADRSGCESFVSREEMASRVAAMRAELERERKLRRESEEAFKAASDPRSGVAQKRGLVTGARVRSLDHAGGVIVCGKIVGWDEDGDPVVEHTIAEHAYTYAYYADLVELDTEATT